MWNSRLFVGLLPWIVFAIVTRAGGLGVRWGSLLSLVVAGVVTAIAIRRGRPTPVEFAAVAVFIVMLLLVLGNLGMPMRFARAISMTPLAALVLLSARRHPFTIGYTRDFVALRIAKTDFFHRVNVALSTIWGVVFAVIAVSHATGTLLSGPFGLSVFHWLVPLTSAMSGGWLTRRIWNECIDESGMSVASMVSSLAGTVKPTATPIVPVTRPFLRLLRGGRAQ